MAKRRKPRVAQQPLLIEEGPWTPAEHKPPRLGHDRSETLLVFNGSYGLDLHIAWFDFYRCQWCNGYGEIADVSHWMKLPEPPRKKMIGV